MASIDLQDAYYSCKVNVNDRKFFLELAKKIPVHMFSNGLSICTKNFHEINETRFINFSKTGIFKHCIH